MKNRFIRSTEFSTEELHALQESLWGWHDMRRKSANQIASPCECNRKGRCYRVDCYLRRSGARK
jgi:hypothetical protein